MIFWVGEGQDLIRQPCLDTQDGQLGILSRMCCILFSSLQDARRIHFSNTGHSSLLCSFSTMSEVSFMAWSALSWSSTSRSCTQDQPCDILPFQAQDVHDLYTGDEVGISMTINIISVALQGCKPNPCEQDCSSWQFTHHDHEDRSSRYAAKENWSSAWL